MRASRFSHPLGLRISGRTLRRGFTLVELLVAIAAGSLVATAAVLLSKNAVRLFQEEARMSYAQVAVANGLARIGVDLEHAGRHITKNPLTDPRLCTQTGVAAWPTGMRRLAPVHIELLADLPQNTGNQIRNERITIAGDMDSGDNWVMNTTLPGATGTTIVLQPQSRSVRRLTALVQNGNITTRLQEIFRAGRILHIEGPTSDYYGRIKGFSVSGNPINNISVQLETTPQVPMQPQSLVPCAIKGFGAGWPVHVVSRVRYEVRPIINEPAFADYVQPLNTVAGDETRTDLIRAELDPDNNVVPGTEELITEYALGMRFGLTALALNSQPDAPILETFPIADPTPDPQIFTIAGPADVPGNRPESIRAISVRLSTRSRAPDRPTTLASQPGRPFRFFVSTAKGSDRFARVRTLERNFALVNMRGGFR